MPRCAGDAARVGVLLLPTARGETPLLLQLKQNPMPVTDAAAEVDWHAMPPALPLGPPWR